MDTGYEASRIYGKCIISYIKKIDRISKYVYQHEMQRLIRSLKKQGKPVKKLEKHNG